ncbi:MAG: hypothetical protein JSU65_03205 [Candidatus Zixiibacteriota bacterium]|nr:MAG: hypothetical protein JSU65_03205 [candidate division Zixibacteria bacterium]
MNLPDYNFLSTPLWLITILQILTLTLHLTAMNFLVGGIIVVLWGRLTDRWQTPAVQSLARMLPTATAATITLGVAPLLFVQLVYPRHVYSASIVSAWFWLMIPVAVAVAYYLFYGASFAKNALKRPTLFYTIAGICLLYVSFVYSSVFSMAEHPADVKELYASSQSGLVINSNLSDYVFRWLHILLAAPVVGGFAAGLIGRDDPTAFSVGKKLLLWGMIGTSVFGLFYLLTLGDILAPFMRSPGIWILVPGILLAFAGLHFYFKRRFVPSGLALLASVLAMVTSRHYLRLIHLYYDPRALTIAMPSWTVTPQWSVFVLFLILIVIAILALIWLLRMVFSNRGASQGE